ncbi:MAG TPA: metallophosphoesterase [Blastocatellia bacterium]|nr:metallophosphoesterase [Blastocatellia bacterium]
MFILKPTDQPVLVLALGDFGFGTDEDRSLAGTGQQRVAAAMLRSHRRRPYDLALTLGDNFYPNGMESPTDARWQSLWADLYDDLDLEFYASLGNHDWNQVDSPAAEILHSQLSSSWRMPASYYTFLAGPAQFFALDTTAVSAAQLQWLDEELEASRARWKIVYGHHPIYSGGTHGDNPRLIEILLPILKDRADIYLAGHDHDMQHLGPEGGVHFFINGAGGAPLRESPPGPRTLFSVSVHGFLSLEADAERMEVALIDTDLNPLYRYTLTGPDLEPGERRT